MILLLFILISNIVSALSLDEALDLYKNTREYESLELQKSAYKESFLEYRKGNAFSIYLQDSGSLYSNKFNSTSGSRQHNWINQLNPGFTLFYLDVNAVVTSDWDISKNSVVGRLQSVSGSFDIVNLLYYSDNKYNSDQLYYTFKQQEISSKIDIRESLENIIDIYSEIKSMESTLEIKSRDRDELVKERKYLDYKKDIGSVAEIDIDRLELEIESASHDILYLKENILAKREILCSKLGIIHVEEMRLEDFLIEEDIDILVDRSKIELLEYKLKASESNVKYKIREMMPKIDVLGSYDWDSDREYKANFGLNISWNITKNRGDLINAKSRVKLAQIALDSAKQDIKTQLVSRKIEYDNLKNAIESSRKERDYWKKLLEIKREMYRKDLISFYEFIKSYNKYRERRVEYLDLLFKLSTMKKKLQLIDKYLY